MPDRKIQPEADEYIQPIQGIVRQTHRQLLMLGIETSIVISGKEIKDAIDHFNVLFDDEQLED